MESDDSKKRRCDDKNRVHRLANDPSLQVYARIATLVISAIAICVAVPAAFAFNRLVTQLDDTSRVVQKLGENVAVITYSMSRLVKRVDDIEGRERVNDSVRY